MSELEEVLDNESMFEILRCNGRGGNECRLVGVVIFPKSSVGSTPAVVSVERGGKAKSVTGSMLILMVRSVTTLSSEFEATGDQDASRFGTQFPLLPSGVGFKLKARRANKPAVV